MRKITAFIIAAVFTSIFLQPKTANAVTITDFSFTGTCSVDCTGTATATLVLQNYTIGSVFDGTKFVSFTYHSDFLGTISVDGSNFVGGSGTFVSLPGAASVVLTWQNGGPFAFAFTSDTSGSWCIGTGCLSDAGTNGVWSLNPVPLPAALPLFATGLGALSLLGWRRKRKAAALAA
jgi:hypothetical protein